MATLNPHPIMNPKTINTQIKHQLKPEIEIKHSENDQYLITSMVMYIIRWIVEQLIQIYDEQAATVVFDLMMNPATKTQLKVQI